MINIKKYILIGSLAIASSLSSCVDDLNTTPIDPNYKSADKIYVDATSYKQGLAKLYASFVLAGQNGAGGNPDIAGGDPGSTVYSRLLYYCQELTTEEAIVAWNDGDIKEFHAQNWTPSNAFVNNMYTRLYLTIGYINQYLRDTETSELLNTLSDKEVKDIKVYRSEARLLRAMVYYNALDLFGNVPLLTEKDPVGSFKPEQKSRADIFSFVQDEVKKIENNLIEPGNNEYGRVDKAVAWSLLARMYLNAKVYIDKDMSTECITYCNKVIPYYTLHNNYSELFKADNHLRTNEIIFAFACDGLRSQTYGATSYIIHAAIGGKYIPTDAGVNGGWGGNRVCPDFVEKFDLSKDSRAMFFTEGQNLEINTVSEFTDGYMYIKYINVNSDGTPGSDDTFTDTDLPIFRLADIYLMYAESVIRGGTGGSANQATEYINKIRERAYGDNSANINAGQLNEELIIDERAKELAWESVRRTDLIRFDKFSNTEYTWAWKGGSKDGNSVDKHLDVFPIPSTQLNSNFKLTQNPGY